jgi:hypothetical protein
MAMDSACLPSALNAGANVELNIIVLMLSCRNVTHILISELFIRVGTSCFPLQFPAKHFLFVGVHVVYGRDS